MDGAAELPAVVSQERPVPALAKAGSERVEDAALGGIFCKTPIASDCLTEFRNVLNIRCNSLGNGVTVAQQTLTLFV